jgi:hypothetical protein
MKDNFLLLILYLSSSLLLAQTPYSWEIGIGSGISAYQGDLDAYRINPGLRNIQPIYALQIRHNLYNKVAMRLNLTSGLLAGDDNYFIESAWRPYRGISFRGPLIEGAFMTEIYPFGLYRRKKGSRSSSRVPLTRRKAAPFIATGMSLVFSDPVVNWNLTESVNPVVPLEKIQADMSAKKNKFNMAFPVGGGIRFALNNQATLGAEAFVRPVFTDYLDGVSVAGNPSGNDWFLTLGVSFCYSIGEEKSKNIIALAAVKGALTPRPIPNDNDKDRDGVTDERDECPDDYGTRGTKGCPDSDRDGIADIKDQCPEIAGNVSLGGCPDSDGDGLTDTEDKCPRLAGKKEYKGCPETDRDRDGVFDLDDMCPDIPGFAKWKGCADYDSDGLPDNSDSCPGLPGALSTKGCPDADNDGVRDSEDICPYIPGVAYKRGCPATTPVPEETDKHKSLFYNSKELEWYEASNPEVEAIIETMKNNTKLHLRIEGNTDNTGKNPSNGILAEQRAKKCYEYLIMRGIEPQRMVVLGFADKRPIAANTTPEGRQLNRRVELHFYEF